MGVHLNLSSGKRENLPPGVPLYEVDVADAAAVQQVFELTRPEQVVHQAAQISVSRSVREPAFDARTNVLGLLNVLEASVKYGSSSFIFASSGGVLYGDVWQPAGEEHPAAPISPYGIAKLTGEFYLQFFARQYGLRCAALRYGNVYGPRQDPHGEAGVVAIFLQRLLAGEAPVINGDSKYIRDYVYVEDVARANLLALEGEWRGFRAYNVGTGLGTDVNQLERGLRQALAKVLGEQGRDTELPAATYGPPRPGDLRSSLLDAGKITRELGWRPQVTLAEGLQRTATWFAGRIEDKV
ncbi:NAD-dependent epimerase/dehydratase family protein [Neomoorella thermoacetica]|uniref:NAD-dependent epimerase/dehydratase family protein n=1 Tax=Neomoorella thermoacetica TaxID=1525 RepID=UPI00215064CA|nr:NAD-dependent epimerase/dehydratase family protein [Moorella thermoacetica]